MSNFATVSKAPDSDSPSCSPLQLRRHIARQLAWQSLLAMGRCAPNPPVAALLLVDTPKQWLLIGGATELAGGRHAEIVCLERWERWQNRLNSLKRLKKSPISSSVPLPCSAGRARLYTTLEPCSHYGRTPPCSEALLRRGYLGRILVWERDSSLQQSGIDQLKAAGRRATILKQRPQSSPAEERSNPCNPCRPSASSISNHTSLGTAFLGGFLNRIAGRGPRLHLKVASSREGIMGLRGGQLHISSPAGISFGQMLRARFDAVVVGPGTLANDMPSLDIRRQALRPIFQARDNSSPKERLACRSGRREILLQQLLWNYDRLVHHTCSRLASYQPARIFILAKYFKQFALFHKMQRAVSQRSKRPPIYLLTEDHAEEWQRAIREQPIPEVALGTLLPPLRSQRFSALFREAMARYGYNEVLVEGGAGLFQALEGGLQEMDRLYLLQSHKKLGELLSEERNKGLRSLYHSYSYSYSRLPSRPPSPLPQELSEEELSEAGLNRGVVSLPSFLRLSDLRPTGAGKEPFQYDLGDESLLFSVISSGS